MPTAGCQRLGLRKRPNSSLLGFLLTRLILKSAYNIGREIKKPFHKWTILWNASQEKVDTEACSEVELRWLGKSESWSDLWPIFTVRLTVRFIWHCLYIQQTHNKEQTITGPGTVTREGNWYYEYYYSGSESTYRYAIGYSRRSSASFKLSWCWLLSSYSSIQAVGGV